MSDQRPMREAQMWSSGKRRRGEQLMVPRATFSSYYGRPVVKKPVWEERDIAGYLFSGGIAAGSAVLAAGAELRGLPALRKVTRMSSMAALAVSTRALASGSAADDGTYTFLEGQIASWTLERNTLATAIKAQLEESAFYGQALDEQLAKSLTDQANQLIDKAVAGAAG